MGNRLCKGFLAKAKKDLTIAIGHRPKRKMILGQLGASRHLIQARFLITLNHKFYEQKTIYGSIRSGCCRTAHGAYRRRSARFLHCFSRKTARRTSLQCWRSSAVPVLRQEWWINLQGNRVSKRKRVGGSLLRRASQSNSTQLQVCSSHKPRFIQAQLNLYGRLSSTRRRP